MIDLGVMRMVAENKLLTSPEACRAMRDLIAEVERLRGQLNCKDNVHYIRKENDGEVCIYCGATW